MKVLYLQGPVDCDRAREVSTAYLDDELARPDRERVEAHLRDCAACRAHYEAEGVFGEGLRARMKREPVPIDFEGRVRAAIAREANAPARAAMRRAGLFAGLLAASIVVTALILPQIRTRSAGALSGPPPVVAVSRQGTIVDVVCDQKGASIAHQLACRVPGHINALKLDDGSYWGLLARTDAGRDLAASPDRRGRRVTVEGSFYPAIRSIAVDTFREATSADARQAPRALATLLEARAHPGSPSRGSA